MLGYFQSTQHEIFFGHILCLTQPTYSGFQSDEIQPLASNLKEVDLTKTRKSVYLNFFKNQIGLLY